VEEVWMAFSSGATLVVGTREMVQSGASLARLLTEVGVTVLSCVPTLLSMLEEDIPTVRLLILGGEACPQELVTRWCKPKRRVINTYGPTEATVVASYAECASGKPVTIGRPLPNYHVCILDDDGRPVSSGVTGEIYIGGVCLARGYVNRPDLTQEKFVSNPLAQAPDAPSRLYRTGDLGCFTIDGDIQFMGRADSQVKLRGFRVELAEIESVLMACSEVCSAVVAVQEVTSGIQQLVAYLVPKQAGELNLAEIRATLRSRLPAYMVPAHFATLDALPTLPSGKVDRKRLPAPRPQQSPIKPGYRAPITELEQKITVVWEALFANVAISVNDDFFYDLGGHSLLAARMVSELRQEPALQDLAVLDLYHHPTIAALAQQIEARRPIAPISVAPAAMQKPSRSALVRRYQLCSLFQVIGVYCLYSMISLQLLIPFAIFQALESWRVPLVNSVILNASLLLLGLYPGLLGLSILIKWVVIGRFQPGSYPLWGVYYYRWWLVRRVQSLVPLQLLSGSPLMNLYCRLMGAKIGANCYLGTHHFQIYDLLTIGDDTSIGIDAQLLGYRVEDGMLKIGPIDIGNRCFVGANSVIGINTQLADRARLGELSLLPDGKGIPTGQYWQGSPAMPNQQIIPPSVNLGGAFQSGSRLKRGWFWLLHLVAIFGFLLVPATATLPGSVLIAYLYEQSGILGLLLGAPVAAVLFIVLFCLETALVKKLLLGKVKAGRYRLMSSFYIRQWLVDRLMVSSLDILRTLYATLYLPPWFRLLGARLGKRVEISTVAHLSPDLLSIADESFVADSVFICAFQVDRGWVTVAPTRIGRRSFLGNSALLPPNSDIGNGCLIGCLSVPPTGGGATEDKTCWLGSPAIFLPRRQENHRFSEQQTYKPPLHLYPQRLAIEFFKVTLPATITFIALSLLVIGLLHLSSQFNWEQTLLIFPALWFGVSLCAALFIIPMKWLLIGKYRSTTKPLWSTFVWRSELITGLYESIAAPLLLNPLLGTPFAACYLRLLGVKIGSRVFLETTLLSEFDLVRIDNDAALNMSCTIQTHLFEDRVMKMSHLHISDRCSVGNMAVVLYETQMQRNSSLNSLSLLMKGEILPANTQWQGIPARLRHQKH